MGLPAVAHIPVVAMVMGHLALSAEKLGVLEEKNEVLAHHVSAEIAVPVVEMDETAVHLHQR